MSIVADFTDLVRVTDFLKHLSDGVATNSEAAVMEAGRAYEADMKKSRLTPLDTGQYKGSIRADLDRTFTGPVAMIGSPMPQTLRLEYGFYGSSGVDVLGRHYNQLPRPHWRPTWDFNLAAYEKIMFNRLVKDVNMI
jgi:hypothetical protein